MEYPHITAQQSPELLSQPGPRTGQRPVWLDPLELQGVMKAYALAPPIMADDIKAEWWADFGLPVAVDPACTVRIWVGPQRETTLNLLYGAEETQGSFNVDLRSKDLFGFVAWLQAISNMPETRTVNTEPDWDRWHDLLDIETTRPLTPEEREEFQRFQIILDKEDEEEKRLAQDSVNKLIAKHEAFRKSIRELVAALVQHR